MKHLWKPFSGHQGRIFISYRRKDSTWFVGRLDDSLSLYFGDGRVFRDVGDIEGGADFPTVLEETLESADALIAVIGPNWLTATDQDGNGLLGEPHDWVGQEISAALEREKPVYPVLVEDTPMPRESELPASLKRLARFNAVSIHDDRWDGDVTRLARIVGLDIPSASERKLTFWNRVATVSLVGSVWLTIAMVAYELVGSYPASDWFNWRGLACPRSVTDSAYEILKHKWQSGLVYGALAPTVVLLFVLAGQLAESKRKYALAGAWAGAIGCALGVVLYLPVCGYFESALFFLLGIPLVVTVLGLMNLSGFTPK